MKKLKCFKAYDIRGKVPDELDTNLAYFIGQSYVETIETKRVVVGYDIRLESKEISEALINGIISKNCDVINIGLCGTEEVYFNSFKRADLEDSIKVDGGIIVTASHNPKGYNGMKMVRHNSQPLSEEDLQKIHDKTVAKLYSDSIKTSSESQLGQIFYEEDKSNYIEHILGYIAIDQLKKREPSLKIIVNPGNGMAGPVLKLMEDKLPFELIYIHDEPDGEFPNGIPNPMIIENRTVTSQAVIQNKADFGVAWDGDFDRCFLFDEQGKFIDGYYIVGLLAQSFLQKFPGETIIHDPRLIWNTIDIVNKYNGRAVESYSGHSFIKAKMRQEYAIYGGEMSAHHYFRDFAYCDSGMIPWLLIAEILTQKESTLSELIAPNLRSYPCSGEINYTVKNAKKIIQNLDKYFLEQGANINYGDGISIEFSDWRFNLRSSNTEPLLRLNLEAKNRELLKKKTHEVNEFIMINNLN